MRIILKKDSVKIPGAKSLQNQKHPNNIVLEKLIKGISKIQ